MACCGAETGSSHLPNNFWSRAAEEPAEPFGVRTNDPIYRPEVLETIESAIASDDAGLRALSLDMHGAFLFVTSDLVKLWTSPMHPDHPEVRWEEQ